METIQKSFRELIKSLSFTQKIKFGCYLPTLLFSSGDVDASVIAAYKQVKGGG